MRTLGAVSVEEKPRPSTVYQIFQHRCHPQSCGGQIKDLTPGEKNVRSDVCLDGETLASWASHRWVAFRLREAVFGGLLWLPFASPSRLTANYIIRFLSVVKRVEIPQGGCDTVYIIFFSSVLSFLLHASQTELWRIITYVIGYVSLCINIKSHIHFPLYICIQRRRFFWIYIYVDLIVCTKRKKKSCYTDI